MAVLPKKGDLSVYADAAIQTIENKLIRRPRKRSGYRMRFIVESAAYPAVG
jgi:IS30 family transposase